MKQPSLKQLVAATTTGLIALWAVRKILHHSQPNAEHTLKETLDTENPPEVVFDHDKMDFFIEMYGYTFDDSDYVVYDTPDQDRVLATDGEPISRYDIGYLGHSETDGIEFVRDDISQIISHIRDSGDLWDDPRDDLQN